MSDNSAQINSPTSAVLTSEHAVGITSWSQVVLKTLFLAGICLDLLLACLMGYLVVARTSYFNLSKVDVFGNHRLSKEEVIAFSNVKKGENLLNIDLEAITTKLRQHPWIREDSVYRRFPGQLVIEIDERIPRAILASDRLYYVDESGKIFTRVSPGDPIDLPLFTGLRPADLRQKSEQAQESLLLALKLTDLMDRPESQLNIRNVREINLSQEDGLTLKMNSGRVIIFGHSNFETKISRYERLKKFLTASGQWHNARIINLDFEDRAIVRSSKDPIPQG
ncbi:MAG: cell division protein FtsQ/DivIB [Desulfomonilaceae bacterium]